MSYIITTFCQGRKYETIKEHWLKRIKSNCFPKDIKIWDQNIPSILNYGYGYAFWDVIRLHNNIELIMKEKIKVIHIDLDIIIEKDIQQLIDLPYDIIISKEIGGPKAYPSECSSKIGFGVCSGFYILHPSSIPFMLNILNFMKTYKFNNYSDQVNLMNYITNDETKKITEEKIILDGREYTNKIIEIDNIKICVLDFNIVTRDPIYNNGQFANHINVDNVDGTNNFIRYFYEDLEKLPLTCRCGKLGDTNICSHIRNQL